jgi:hypothetical protein
MQQSEYAEYAPTEMKSICQRDLNVYCSSIYSCQDMESTKVFVNGCTDFKNVIQIHNRILLTHKKKKVLSFATARLNLQNIILSEISQAQIDKYYTFSLICGC